MKQNLLMVGILLVTSILSMSSFSILENPQDPPTEEKVTKHITISKIDESGNTIKLDTTLGISEILVWNGDTIKGKSVSTWISEHGVNTDSILKNITYNFEVETDDDGENKVIILKSGMGDKHAIHEFISDGDSNRTIKIEVETDDFFNDHDVMVWNDDENETFFAPHNIDVPSPPRVRIRKEIDRSNVIDLSDPGIISYKKKTNRDGTEKITIIRKKVEEPDIEKEEEIIMHLNQNQPIEFFNNIPKSQQIQIIKEIE